MTDPSHDPALPHAPATTQPRSRTTTRIRVRFSPSEMKEIHRAARRDGFTSPSSWLLHVALGAAREEASRG